IPSMNFSSLFGRKQVKNALRRRREKPKWRLVLAALKKSRTTTANANALKLSCEVLRIFVT
ncbi:hypothetical protein KI387_027466, partial [Taxus chinensis]